MSYKNVEVDIKDKPLLTINEASKYFGIGITKLTELVNAPNCTFVLNNGNKKLIKKDIFNDFLMKSRKI